MADIRTRLQGQDFPQPLRVCRKTLFDNLNELPFHRVSAVDLTRYRHSELIVGLLMWHVIPPPLTRSNARNISQHKILEESDAKIRQGGCCMSKFMTEEECEVRWKVGLAVGPGRADTHSAIPIAVQIIL